MVGDSAVADVNEAEGDDAEPQACDQGSRRTDRTMTALYLRQMSWLVTVQLLVRLRMMLLSFTLPNQSSKFSELKISQIFSFQRRVD